MAAGPVAFCERNAREITAPTPARCHSDIRWWALRPPALNAFRVGGFFLLRNKASAARPPALKPVPATPAAAPAQSGPATVESLGQQLRQALPARRLHSVSLCDREANVLWLSEGALGPDEHALVVEALELLAADTSLNIHETGTEDGRLALFLPVRTPTADLAGVAMILADSKTLSDDTLERMSAAPVRAIMLRLAMLLKPPAAAPPAAAPPAAAPPVPPPATAPESDIPDAPDVEAALAALPAVPLMSAEEVDQMLEFDLADEKPEKPLPPLRDIPVARPARAMRLAPPTESADGDMLSLEMLDEPASATKPAKRSAAAPPPAAPVAPPAARPAPAVRHSAAPRASSPAAHGTPPNTKAAPAHAPPPPAAIKPPAPAAAAAAPAPAPAAIISAPPDVNVQLEVVPFGKLRAGGQTRRFQVTARVAGNMRDPAAQDALVLQRLMGWLAAHRAAWNSQPTGFTINLSIATLEDERFAQKLAATLHSHGIAGDTFGFEIAEALCTQRRAQVERFITQCEKVGAWIVIDDFSFDSQVLALLRSKAVRVVKIDTRLTSSALKDKLCQAMVVATVQAAKVLGIHCAAKKVDSQAALQWLTAIGCDFAQGAALAAPQSLESLASSPDPTGLCPVLRAT
jgi:EAL domain-containing protein (putative c-di-GMP-specific phosphodiesterase class I)